MWRRRTSAALLVMIMCGCSLISFDRLTVRIWPRHRDAVLPIGASPWVEFPTGPDRPSTQRLLTLSAPEGPVTGDFRWSGRRMYFDPAPALRPGVRYVLVFRGRVTLENGDAFDADEEVPFYVGHLGPGPSLLGADPPDGTIAGIDRPLVLCFSSRIDSNSFAREFDLQPSCETMVTWDPAGLVVTVTPKDAWQNLATYFWKIGTNLCAPDGTPTGLECSGRFRVQEDDVPPSVASVQPAVHDNFDPISLPLSGIKADDAILITFSEDIRAESLSSAFTLAPTTRGTILRIGPGVFVFSPESRLLMDRRYTLRIAQTVEDLAGNHLASPYEVSFVPDIPIQSIASITAVYPTGDDVWTVFNMLEAKEITVDVEGTLRLVLRFAQAFATESRAKLVSALLMAGYFPSSVQDPSLVSASWADGLTLSLVYAGLQKSDPGVGKYYKLTVTGGPAASDNGSGSFLKDDVWLYFISGS
jgi:hypothetical protein